ncbi:MAG: aminotransferase class V-fold PLP-dependent enzyme [Geodermatophilaceae bacterium]
MARWPASLVAPFSSAPERRPRRPYWPAAQTTNPPPRTGPGRSAAPFDASAFDPADWASVRDQFPLTRDLAHFSAFVLAAPPRQVGAALDLHRRGLDEDTLGYLVQNEGDLERAVLDSAASYLGAENADIALTDSTTMGLGLVYGGLRLRANQQVLTTEHDFFSTHESLRLAAARSGATISRVSLYDEPATASADEIVARLMAGVTPATRVVAVTWVHSGPGVKLPINAISAAPADLNAGDRRGHPAFRRRQLRGLAGQHRGSDHARRTDPHPGRIPHVRVQMGAQRGVPVPPRHRQNRGSRTHPHPGHPAQGRPGRHRRRSGGHTSGG